MKTSKECKCLEAIATILKTHEQHIKVREMTLKEKLVFNRSQKGIGSGNDYWESVEKIAREHFGK